jgi:hypothetical protein
VVVSENSPAMLTTILCTHVVSLVHGILFFHSLSQRLTVKVPTMVLSFQILTMWKNTTMKFPQDLSL